MEIYVEKLTTVDLMRRANKFTTQKDSKMSLQTGYRHLHSPVRTQLFWIEMINIPLFVASQFVRSKIGVEWWQRSKRTDRGGEDFGAECYDFGQRIDLLAENVNGGITDEEADSITATLNDMEKEIKNFPTRFDRYAPTDLACLINAEALINMAHKRLCSKASKETREIFSAIRNEIEKCDPDLAKHLVPTCIYRNGLCPETPCCKYYSSPVGEKILEEYQQLMKF